MKAGTTRTIGAVCSITMAALAIVVLIYAAGAKLATIDSKLVSIDGRLNGIEGSLKEIANGRPVADTSGRSGSPSGVADVGRSDPLCGLLPIGAGDDTDGALVLHGD